MPKNKKTINYKGFIALLLIIMLANVVFEFFLLRDYHIVEDNFFRVNQDLTTYYLQGKSCCDEKDKLNNDINTLSKQNLVCQKSLEQTKLHKDEDRIFYETYLKEAINLRQVSCYKPLNDKLIKGVASKTMTNTIAYIWYMENGYVCEDII